MGETLFHGADIGTASAVFLLLHGRDQSPADMMQDVVSRLPLPEVAWVLPKSPRAAWYDARAIDPLALVTREQLAEGIGVIDDMLAQIRRAQPAVPVLLAGFSQGACLTAEYLFARGGVVDAAAILTGCRVGVAGDTRPMAPLRGLPVYTSGSDVDPWIPAHAFHAMQEELTTAGARIRADLLPGRAHEVAKTEIAALSAMLTELAAGRPALEAA
ncbi:MAG: hypothetical protein P1U72_13310 [Paracoccaceae bacterium]|nr:hypothetical protein [Paracoccaceae bacterium]